MTDVWSSQEMADLMAELEALLALHNLKIVELRALELLRADTVASLEELNRKQAEIMNAVFVKQFAFSWLSDLSSSLGIEAFRAPGES